MPGASPTAKWLFISEGLGRFAGRDLTLSDEVYASASRTNHRNRAIASLLASRRRIYCDPAEAVDLADGGVNPVTGQRVVSQAVCRHVLAVMATAGMYETSGDWLFDVGVPGKSGIGGGIVGLAGQGRAGDVLPAPGPRGQQRQGPAWRHGTFPERSD